MERFVKPAGQGRAGNRTPSPRPGDDVGPRVLVQRVATGWIDEAAGQCKLKGVPASQGGIVFVEKPSLDYFLRGGRKRAPSKLAPVFEHELMKVITPPVAWTPKGAPPDTVCLSCFDVFKSARDGTERLVGHCIKCYGMDHLKQFEDLLPKEGDLDRRSTPAEGMSYDAMLSRNREKTRFVRFPPRGRQRRQSPPEGPGQGGKGRNGDAATPGQKGQERAQRGLGAGTAEKSGAEQNAGTGRAPGGKSYLRHSRAQGSVYVSGQYVASGHASHSRRSSNGSPSYVHRSVPSPPKKTL